LAEIEGLYGGGAVEFDLSSATGYFRHREAKLDYGQFSKPAPVARARAYMAEHAAELAGAEKAYGVDPKIITAILLVETSLGKYAGKRGVLSTLSTLAALAEPENQEALREEVERVNNSLPAGKKDEAATREDVAAWCGRKPEWAYGQLVAFLDFARQNRLAPEEVRGSYAGAFGFSQFMPQSAKTDARDGDGDGRIDLFTHADAIHSIAAYLAARGWKAGMRLEETRAVLMTYNRSSYYVDALLAVRKKLEETP
jgi:membrane-bound lytic murein transglycosylase B